MITTPERHEFKGSPRGACFSLPLVRRELSQHIWQVLHFHLSGWKLVHHPCQCMFRHLYFSLRACSHHHTLQRSERGNLTSNFCYVTYTKSHYSSTPLITQKPPKAQGMKFQGLVRVWGRSKKYRVDQRGLWQRESSCWLPIWPLPGCQHMIFLHPFLVGTRYYEVNVYVLFLNSYSEAPPHTVLGLETELAEAVVLRLCDCGETITMVSVPV